MSLRNDRPTIPSKVNYENKDEDVRYSLAKKSHVFVFNGQKDCSALVKFSRVNTFEMHLTYYHKITKSMSMTSVNNFSNVMTSSLFNLRFGDPKQCELNIADRCMKSKQTQSLLFNFSVT